ncbi:hypothetical protein [Vallitalea okinawensis]|uniref:hypothetical protein n=1 Tax=Vallitalea okinawensis TaxID=2078660 RepID=UPI000CFAE2B3|nr:hypothetical protein [Vallitalea okinawensis]
MRKHTLQICIFLCALFLTGCSSDEVIDAEMLLSMQKENESLIQEKKELENQLKELSNSYTEIKLANERFVEEIEKLEVKIDEENNIILEIRNENFIMQEQLAAKNLVDNYDSADNTENEDKLVNEKWEAVTNERVKLRLEPTQEAVTIDVNYLNLHFSSFLKGTKLMVLGRSPQKDKFNNIENYWYYVQYSNGIVTQYGWVYGEFIQELNIESNYVSDFKEEINWLITIGELNDVSSSENLADLEEEVNKLIKRNAEAIDIFKTSTLIFDPELPDSDGVKLTGPEYPVISNRFKSFEDLETFLYSTYVKEYADHMLYTWEQGNEPLYLNVDGQLYIDSTYAGARGYYVDWNNYTIEISNISENQVDVKIFLVNYDPGSYDYLTIEVKLIKQSGEWLLEEMVW